MRNYFCFARSPPPIKRLLIRSSCECVAHAEAHAYEYAAVVEPFIETLCQEHFDDDANFQISNPNAVFDVHEEEAQMLYFVVRALIRRPRAPNCMDKIQRSKRPAIGANALCDR